MNPHLINQDTDPLYDLASLERTVPITICGCDPGPEFCAFVAITYNPEDHSAKCAAAGFLDNELLESMDNTNSLAKWLGLGDVHVFAYEKVANQGRIVGKQVFDTCAMSGSLRRHALHDMGSKVIFSFMPSDWRWITVGFGNAKDTDTRASLHEAEVDSLEAVIMAQAKAAKARYQLAKSCTPHLRDAAGVALACLLITRKLGDDALQRRLVYKRGM